jgi:hypothetical protein
LLAGATLSNEESKKAGNLVPDFMFSLLNWKAGFFSANVGCPGEMIPPSAREDARPTAESAAFLSFASIGEHSRLKVVREFPPFHNGGYGRLGDASLPANIPKSASN